MVSEKSITMSLSKEQLNAILMTNEVTKSTFLEAILLVYTLQRIIVFIHLSQIRIITTYKELIGLHGLLEMMFCHFSIHLDAPSHILIFLITTRKLRNSLMK